MVVSQTPKVGFYAVIHSIFYWAGDTPSMLHQFTPALFFYEQVSGIIGETVSAMTSGAGRYGQCAQFASLILESARQQAFFEPGYRIVNCIARVLFFVFLMAN
jgi:hypothetical protein